MTSEEPAEPENLRIATTTRQVSVGGGPTAGVAQRLNFSGGLSGGLYRNLFPQDTIGYVSFLRGWEADESFRKRLWKNVDGEPVATMGSLSYPEGDECYCNVGIRDDEFDLLVTETRNLDWANNQLECQIEFVARSPLGWDNPLENGLYPIVGWNVAVKSQAT